MAQSVAPPPRKVDLGPIFWPWTIGMGVWSVVTGYYIATVHLGQFLPVASDRGYDIDFLFKFMSVFGNAIITFVTGYIMYFAVVFRRKSTDPPDAIGVQIHDNVTLELWWTIVPTILLLIVAAMSTAVWYKIQYGTSTAALSIEVIGHQFGYAFRYPGLAGTTSEMHMPLNKPVHLEITSQDVLHSFWVPEMRLKADTVPGLVQNLNFTPVRTGTYVIECTNYCGAGHSKMVGTVVVESPDRFAAWLDAQKSAAAAPPPANQAVALASGSAAAGQALFAEKCSACHAIAPYEHKVVGPGLGKLFVDGEHPKLVDGAAVTPEHVASILENGYNGGAAGVMPNAQMNGLTAKNVADLTAYLHSLK